MSDTTPTDPIPDATPEDRAIDLPCEYAEWEEVANHNLNAVNKVSLYSFAMAMGRRCHAAERENAVLRAEVERKTPLWDRKMASAAADAMAGYEQRIADLEAELAAKVEARREERIRCVEALRMLQREYVGMVAEWAAINCAVAAIRARGTGPDAVTQAVAAPHEGR